MRRFAVRTVSRLFPLLVAAGAVAACDAGPSGPRVATGRLAIHANVSATSVAVLVLRVTGADIPEALAFNVPVSNGVASTSVVLPAGSERTLELRAYDRNGFETHYGSRLMDVVAGLNPTVTITLAPLAGTAPIIVNVGGIIVDVSADTSGYEGTEIQLSAVVYDDQNEPMNVQPAWLTLDPSIATVSQDGLVTLLESGTARIVAAYAGVGDLATITVFPACCAVAAPIPPSAR